MLKILKPSLLKIAAAPVLFLVISWLWAFKNMYIMDASFHGVPLTFFTVWGLCRPGETCSEFSGLNFMLDLAFWYLVGALLVEAVARRRRKDAGR